MSRFPVFLLLATCVAGQQIPTPHTLGRAGAPRRPTHSAPTVPRVRQVDAKVADAAGHPATGLTAADFDLSVAGKSIPITSFTYVTADPHRLVLVVDDTAISLQAVQRVHAALRQFVQQQRQSGDEVAILRTRSGSGVLEVLTADKALLGDAIDQIEATPASGQPDKTREQFVLTAMASTLRRTLTGLAAVTGRKSVVLISENLALARQHADLFQGFAGMAADASAVFYGVDLLNSSSGVELDSLMLAGDTGGLNLGPDPGAPLARVQQDQEGYYLLGYQPEANDEPSGQTKVQAKSADLFVRSRVSPLGAGTPERDFRLQTPNQELAGALNSPFLGGAIHTRVCALFGDSRAGGPVSTAAVWIDARDLTFTHQLNGQHHASAQVVVAAFGNTGRSTGQIIYTVTLQLDAEHYQNALQHGWIAQTRLGIPAPGVYQVRAVVRDETSSRMGTADQLMELPDLSSGELRLSDIVLQAKDYATVEAGPALRTFTPGASLYFAYQIFNAANDQGNTVATETLLRLLRGDQEVFRGTPQVLPVIKLDDANQRSVMGEVRLGAKLPAGRYWLDVTVTEKHAEKPRSAGHRVDFLVQ